MRFLLVVAFVLLWSALAFAYTLGPGDQLDIEILTEQTSISLQPTVSVDGRVHVAPAGSFVAEGKTPAELEAAIAKGLGQYYVGDVRVTVLLMVPKELPVSVLGQVRQPGQYRIVDDRPLLSGAIAKAGGLLPQASARRVSLLRKGQELGPVDLYAILNLGRSDLDVALQPDDIIYVPARERWATVLGAAEQPAIYELAPGDRLSNLLRMAGGLTVVADSRRAVIERMGADGHLQTVPVNPEAALAKPGGDADVLLEPGDTLRLPNRVAQVYVLGQVVEPGAKEFQDNRTVLDYLALAGGTTARAVTYRIGIVRPGNPQPEVIPVDVAALMQGTPKQPPPVIQPGDMIYVPERRIATIQDWGSIGQILTGIFAGIRLF